MPEARAIVEACERAEVALQVNQNMRYDQSVRALRSLLDRGVLGAPVLEPSGLPRDILSA